MKRGYECKLYRNTGTYAVPVWTEVPEVDDLNKSQERSEYDGTTRGSGDFMSSESGRVKISVDWGMLWNPANANFAALRNAYNNRTVLDLMIVDRVSTDPLATGVRGDFYIFKFDEGEPKDGMKTLKLTLKPTTATHQPIWLPAA